LKIINLDSYTICASIFFSLILTYVDVNILHDEGIKIILKFVLNNYHKNNSLII